MVNCDTLTCCHRTASRDDTWCCKVEMGEEGEGEGEVVLSLSLACCSVMYDSADTMIEAGDASDTDDCDSDCDGVNIEHKEEEEEEGKEVLVDWTSPPLPVSVSVSESEEVLLTTTDALYCSHALLSPTAASTYPSDTASIMDLKN